MKPKRFFPLCALSLLSPPAAKNALPRALKLSRQHRLRQRRLSGAMGRAKPGRESGRYLNVRHAIALSRRERTATRSWMNWSLWIPAALAPLPEGYRYLLARKWPGQGRARCHSATGPVKPFIKRCANKHNGPLHRLFQTHSPLLQLRPAAGFEGSSWPQ